LKVHREGDVDGENELEIDGGVGASGIAGPQNDKERDAGRAETRDPGHVQKTATTRKGCKGLRHTGQRIVKAHGRRCRNRSTASLYCRSPTAFIWSRPAISTASAPGMRAASAGADPPTTSSLPTATRTGQVMRLTCSAVSGARDE